MNPLYWQVAGVWCRIGFENEERVAEFMRGCQGRVMLSINDQTDIRRVFGGFHFDRQDSGIE
ncbi:hypothetical protein CDA60_01195 [Pseudomonas fragi]|nr:hypothetical protein CDA60_01195 [Pseudomonas fragi]